MINKPQNVIKCIIVFLYIFIFQCTLLSIADPFEYGYTFRFFLLHCIYNLSLFILLIFLLRKKIKSIRESATSIEKTIETINVLILFILPFIMSVTLYWILNHYLSRFL